MTNSVAVVSSVTHVPPDFFKPEVCQLNVTIFAVGIGLLKCYARIVIVRAKKFGEAFASLLHVRT